MTEAELKEARIHLARIAATARWQKLTDSAERSRIMKRVRRGQSYRARVPKSAKRPAKRA